MLKAEIQGVGIPDKGVPQGGILSPLLANVVLNELDWWISSQWETLKTRKEFDTTGHKFFALKKTGLKEVFIVRYADDFKLMCRTRTTATAMFHATAQWLKERLSLEISEEKSKIVNLKKRYSEFLGIKIKVHQKSSKWVTQSKVNDKCVKKCKEKLRKTIKAMQGNPNIEKVLKYNAAILGMHRYYRVATEVARDFADISFSLKKCLYNRTHKYSNAKGSKSKCFIKYYGRYAGKMIYLCKTALFPISHIRTDAPLGFTQSKCNYTPDGRKLLHDELIGIDAKVLIYLMKNPIGNASAELHDNRISLYAGQHGKCHITGKPLAIGDVEIHHIKPKGQGGGDKYKNLCLICTDAHKLIHATQEETIERYLMKLKLSQTAIAKLNKLRVLVGSCELTGNK